MLVWGVTAGFLALAGLAVAVAVWVHRVGRGAPATVFVGVLAVDAIWLITCAGYIATGSLDVMTALLEAQGGLAALSGLAWFVFTLFYTGRDHWLTTPVKLVLAGLAAAYVLIPATNSWTGWIGTDGTRIAEPIPHVEATYGPLTFPMFLTSTTLTIAGLLLLGDLLVRSKHATRRQSGLLLTAAAIPMVLVSGQVLEVLPYPMLPYGAVGIGLFTALAGVAMFRNQLFIAEPVARSKVIEQLEDPVLVVSGDRLIIDYNPAAEETFGSLDVGTPVDDQLPMLVETDEDGTSYVEYLPITVEGTERTYSLEWSTLSISSSGESEALVLRDITDREEYARELERQADQLERIAATVSHDLRNPLSIAAGNVELAAETGDTDHLETASESLDRMDRIISDVLTLSREGQRIETLETVEVETVAREAWLTAETMEAELMIEDETATIEADPARVRRILENLFRNSVEHGGTAVTIWVGVEGNSFYVADDGQGIPPESREEVFEYGYSTEDDNTGFGLDIVKSLANAHDWSVEIQSSRAGGARFVFDGVTVGRAPEESPPTGAAPRDDSVTDD